MVLEDFSWRNIGVCSKSIFQIRYPLIHKIGIENNLFSFQIISINPQIVLCIQLIKFCTGTKFYFVDLVYVSSIDLVESKYITKTVTNNLAYQWRTSWIWLLNRTIANKLIFINDVLNLAFCHLNDNFERVKNEHIFSFQFSVV